MKRRSMPAAWSLMGSLLLALSLGTGSAAADHCPDIFGGLAQTIDPRTGRVIPHAQVLCDEETPARPPAQQQQTQTTRPSAQQQPAQPAQPPVQQQQPPPAQPTQTAQETAQQPGANPADDRALLLALWGPIRGGDIPSQLVSPQEMAEGEDAMVQASIEFRRQLGKDNPLEAYVGAAIGRAAYYGALRGSDGKPLFPSLASNSMLGVITRLGVQAAGGELNALVALNRLIDLLARQDAALLPAASRQ